MRLKLNYIFLSLSLLALPGCKENEALVEPPIDIPDSEKTPIELSVGIAEGGFDSKVTRAVIIDGTSKTLRAFEKDTRLFFMMVAEDGNNETGHTKGATLYGYNYGKAAGQASPADGSKSTVTHPDDNWLYWDDAYARDTKVSIYSIAAGCLERENSDFGKIWASDYNSFTLSNKVGYSGNGYSKVINFNDETTISGASDDNRFITGWTIKAGGDIDWNTTSGTGISYQDKTSFESQDLVFSNNIANYDADGTNATKDKRLKFHSESGTMYHKFDKAELIYYHALTKLTINIYCGDGFNGNGSDFAFTNCLNSQDNSFAINGFYGRGDFNLKNGEFVTGHSKSPLKVNYTSIYLKSTQHDNLANPYYTLVAYVLPGTDLLESGVADANKIENAFSFTIDNNKYDISMKQLYEAIKDKKDASNNYVNSSDNGSTVKNTVLDNGKLIAGNNYLFSFKVSKSKIKGITAQLVDWETVSADDIYPSNAKIKLQLEERGSDLNQEANMYRLAETTTTISDAYPSADGSAGYQWTNGSYGDKNVYKKNDATNTWNISDKWCWPNNITYYHFRAVSPTSLEKKTENSVDYVELSSGATYTDVLWGAPMKDNANDETSGTFKWSYSTSKGFDGKGAEATSPTHQIYHGIGATDDYVKLLLFHMMSDVTFTVKSTEDASDPTYVNVGNGTEGNKTTIYFKKINTKGRVDLGDGKVTPSTSNDNVFITLQSGKTNQWAYGAIPQSLADVVLVIKTPDNNLYEVEMDKIWIASNKITTNNLVNPYTEGTGDKAGTYNVNYWYPGYKYSYTFLLKKKGIEKITATVLDWETVTAGNDNVQIK